MSCRASASGRTEAGLTLLEMVAVVAIFGLLTLLTLPNLGSRGDRALEEAARRISAELELARQRSVMTGVSHRLVVDLEEGLYHLEWHVPRASEPAPEPLPGQQPLVQMAPPPRVRSEFRRLPGPLGRVTRLDDPVIFVALESQTGLAVDGIAVIRFEGDGTTDQAGLVLGTAAGRSLTLEVATLSDEVRIRDER